MRMLLGLSLKDFAIPTFSISRVLYYFSPQVCRHVFVLCALGSGNLSALHWLQYMAVCHA